MASIKIKSWERVITDIRLVPKLVILMLLSTFLIIAKQLWDANTFYNSVVSVLESQTQHMAVSEAGTIDNLLKNNATDKDIQKTYNLIADKTKQEGQFTYLIDLSSGKVLGNPDFSSVNALTETTDQGLSLSQVLSGKTQGVAFSLNEGESLQYAVKTKNADWLVVVSQSSEVAQAYYDSYIWQVVWQTLGLIVIFISVLLGAAHVMLRQTNYIADSIKMMASKNLSEQIELDCKDEYGDLARELEKTRVQLQDVIKAQVDSSQELSSMTEMMTLSMSETKEASQEEFNEIDQLATAMNEMSGTVQTVAEHARNASAVTESAAEQAKTGQEFVLGSVNKIRELSADITNSASAVNQVEERVESISSVVGTIQGISEQTNLLALNAAIEAARAGEAGRGFAVVADEVRNLAQSTQTATIEIQEMISQLQASANSAVELMEKSVVEAADGAELVTNAGDELSGIVEQVNNINDMNFQIATAADQQSTVAEEMSQNLSNVRELVEASVVVVTELLETSEEMQNNAEELDGKIRSFQV
ncbi:methyl-accepting chemotaxis protein [Vibrio sp. SCSIO 43137]|uniref:methyl-accepting chemotaxis protein n=1 Tax=Vibrio sp. SCSIO 43137 TaxID=3021011 RepID=UPI002307A32F|nr:methyl-accepting chemotaxis protein [Vibrio sp. SCSIO 43137]WCE29297.1 methyl-accepting chemotaxis protein [Vibrio sp. SCSIO 43137]